MASIFNSLGIGYSGLNAAQVGINTTGNNIANAETDGYTRQRVIQSSATPLSLNPGNVGNGVEIQTIKRVFDNFVFDRYTDSYTKKEYVELEKGTLEKLSTYFPEIDDVGIKSDLQEYYNMWQSFGDNPDNESIKLALVKQADILSQHINYTQDQVKTLQLELNDKIKVNVDEVNTLAKELTQINQAIDTAESGDLYDANDLRDKRNVIERDLARLIGATTSRDQLTSNIQIDSSSNTKTGSYTVSINGFNLVDGTSYHPITVSNEKNASGFYEISFEREDGVLVPLEEKLNGGKIGALMTLRGGAIDTTSGVPKDGILQNTIAQLDSFAATLIESTNNIYASSATTRMTSNTIELNDTTPITSSGLNVKEGSFNLIVYDIDGNVAGKREIKIDFATTMSGTTDTNSIEAQMNAQIDDNADGNANNDIDDMLNFNFATYASGDRAVEFTMDAAFESKGYTFAIEDTLTDDSFDSGTNFAGALGMHRFFDGDSASSIDVNFSIKSDPTTLSGGKTSISGDSSLALNMVQQQFENIEFKVGSSSVNTTIYGMFDIIATEVGTATNSAILRNETIAAQFNAIEIEYASTSKVSIDEEMTNLIRYQTSYGAAAKIITTIDQMMQTLLGIKQ
ncbi:flagellar hook-associated protein FlgK [Sulfurimonas sp. SAG-AH-194-I05]|nr:flagellar hook-associated protein FlgK [Sulfurimonas sp. SAG-AH-194-I05]MDF1874310.1 flagellar hook-associated protein FlgK [Sulfurimonas sp. SAG-AH-194-I05]